MVKQNWRMMKKLQQAYKKLLILKIDYWNMIGQGEQCGELLVVDNIRVKWGLQEKFMLLLFMTYLGKPVICYSFSANFVWILNWILCLKIHISVGILLYNISCLQCKENASYRRPKWLFHSRFQFVVVTYRQSGLVQARSRVERKTPRFTKRTQCHHWSGRKKSFRMYWLC